MNKVKKYNIRIIIPVFNDNISLNILIKNIYDQANKYDYFFEILIIDDNSNKEIFIKSASSYKDRLYINILKNKQNLGHQKAIFMGLNYTLTNPIDKIIVMDKGRIVEQGNHLELINLGGIYKKLYELQYS